MRLTEQRLGADIEAGRLARVYLLYGEEDFLIRMYTDKLTELCVPSELGDARDMNFVRYSLVPGADKGSKDDRPPRIDELSDFADSMPFFAERKCVLLKNFDPDALDKSELEAYLAFIGDIPETSTVIFTRENTEGDPKKYKEKLAHAKMKQIIEAVDRNGIVCELAPFDERRLCKMAAGKAKRAGCELSAENAAFLAECVGGSLSLLQTEVEKLCAYRRSGEITREDIEALVPKRVESNVYALAGELFAGRTGAALEMLRAVREAYRADNHYGGAVGILCRSLQSEARDKRGKVLFRYCGGVRLQGARVRYEKRLRARAESFGKTARGLRCGTL